MEKNEVEYWVKQIAAHACVWFKQCGNGLCVRDKQCGNERDGGARVNVSDLLRPV